MKKTEYRDFVGTIISTKIDPYSFSSEYKALKAELWKRIKKELPYSNGLLCDFKKVRTTINKKIIVSGTVTECEVDCG